VHVLGGYKVQGKGEAAAQRLKDDALALQKAGATMIVLEAIPAVLATEVTASLNIITIGIGAGKETPARSWSCTTLSISTGQKSQVRPQLHGRRQQHSRCRLSRTWPPPRMAATPAPNTPTPVNFMQIISSIADLRAALRGAAASFSCRPWAICTPATSA
jgi:hypothetical protein